MCNLEDTVLKMKLLLLTKFFGIIAGHCFAVYFNERETSPSLIKVKEGEELQLNCSYCVKSSKEDTTLSWYKDGYVIAEERKQFKKRHLEIKNIIYDDHGVYTCTAENLLGRVQLSVNVTVKGNYSIEINGRSLALRLE